MEAYELGLASRVLSLLENQFRPSWMVGGNTLPDSLAWTLHLGVNTKRLTAAIRRLDLKG